MTTIFVPEYEWNAHWLSIDEAYYAGVSCGDFVEGDEFTIIRLTVGAKTTYKVIDGKPVPIVVTSSEGVLK